MSLEKEINKQFEATRLWLEQSQGISPGATLSPEKIKRLVSYLELLQRWAKKMDLVAPASIEQIIERHLVDSYAAYLLIKNSINAFGSCLDVGSGAGLPGLVFAILDSEGHFTLCEPREKRQIFLREASQDLSYVEVLGLRLEDIPTENLAAKKFNLITSRALGMEESFDAHARPLLAGGGKICQMLGPSWEQGEREDPVSILNYSLYQGGPERKLVLWD